MSAPMRGQTNLAATILPVALAPACEMLWICWNTENRFSAGIRGQTAPHETSQNRVSPSAWKGATCKEELLAASSNSGEWLCDTASLR
jgi:hypothetical protein